MQEVKSEFEVRFGGKMGKRSRKWERFQSNEGEKCHVSYEESIDKPMYIAPFKGNEQS